VGLLDADIYGPSVALMLGVADGTRPDTRDGKLPAADRGPRSASMSMAYLANERTPMVWRGPMAGGALVQMLEQTDWGELDYLIIDMPPGTGDIQLTLSQKASWPVR
jgi:ATP-binding protein involved in chromosome partitioning